MTSIRANLVLWMASALVLGTAVVLGATYALTRNEVGRVFDEELRQVAHAVHLREDWSQTRRIRIARPGFELSVRAYDKTGRIYFETALPSLPADLAQTYQEGFASVGTQEGAWRVYTHVTEEGIVQVGQALAARDVLARDLSISVLMPMLMLIPLLVVIVAWVLKRGLAPLDETSRRVSDRDASRLDPLPTHGVPEELAPLVEQINALLARLEGSLDAQRRFLADAAHELRSPVAALALQVQLAERAHSAQAREAAFRELAHGVERARRLVQQLLDFARLEPGVQAEPFAATDLARLVREVVGRYAAQAEAQDVDLGADAPSAAPMLGSEPQLRSLIENLVDNALRYAPRESAVTVSVRVQEDGIELAVVDAGRGIPEAERERVFERFHRVAGDHTRGSGLGLAISRAIVEHHQGSITLSDAHPGGGQPGLAVVIKLPLPQRPAAGEHTALKSSLSFGGAS
ncbi:MAG TPA: ATP-binding protein [Burkholderiales bacterium]